LALLHPGLHDLVAPQLSNERDVIPKSTAKLQPGDCCLVPRADGGYVPFVFVCKDGSSRTSFHGAIGNAVLPEADLVALGTNIQLTAAALVHVQCFAKNDTPIVGNIKDRIAAGELERIEAAAADMSIGAVKSVWGYKTILKRANEIDARP